MNGKNDRKMEHRKMRCEGHGGERHGVVEKPAFGLARGVMRRID
jgi:hypothetical protein